MVIDWKKVEKPVIYTVLGVLLFLSVKSCADGNKAREANENIKDVAANVDDLCADADTIKSYVRDTVYPVVKNVEKDVSDIKRTTDSTLNIVERIEDKIDSCCDCNAKQQVKKNSGSQRKSVTKESKKTPRVDENAVRSSQRTLVVVNGDTISNTIEMESCVKSGVADTNVVEVRRDLQVQVRTWVVETRQRIR